MHEWSDGWPLWEQMEDMVARARELVDDLVPYFDDVKEKWGTLRVYCMSPAGFEEQRNYRELYRILLEEYPELRAEILEAADWPEYLEGL